MKIFKDKKLLIESAVIIGLLAVLGVTFAYFEMTIDNKDVKDQIVTTGTLKIKFSDGQDINITNLDPGTEITKTVSVENTGSMNTGYNLVWELLENGITNNELLFEGSCKRLVNGVEDGTCSDITSKPIGNTVIKRISNIEAGVTHEYSIKITFVDTGSDQNYNMEKTFHGKLGATLYSSPVALRCTTSDTLAVGTEYVNGPYTYRYKQEFAYGSSGLAWTSMNSDGWGVILTNPDSTDAVTEAPCAYINDKPVTSMSEMFAYSSASMIDTSEFNTSNVTNMKGMFESTYTTSLYLDDLDTSNVTDMSGMFVYYQGKSVDVSGFDTSKVTNMSSMFLQSNLIQIKGLENFNTSNVTNMNGMFAYIDVTKIDSSSFDTNNVTDMSGMFAYCDNLKTLYVSDKFVTTNVTSSNAMFYGISSIVGGSGTTYDSTKIDKTYARIDGGTSSPGYFTKK